LDADTSWKLADEVADVHVMLRQIEIGFEIPGMVNDRERFKLSRLAGKLDH
jgi:hypothetical protein